MTGGEWEVCDDIEAMLHSLNRLSSITPGRRKLALFACGCCRQIWQCLTNQRSREFVVLAERFADQGVNEDLAFRARVVGGAYALAPAALALDVSTGRRELNTTTLALEAARAASRCAANTRLVVKQCGICRDIFGNPFRPVAVDPAWLAWRNGTVAKLAQTIYDDRRFDLLQILADALQEAGCTNADILQHCHAPGPHVRGCWVVDLLLGKA